ncbi:MAG: HEAT repeat domain-containing protein [Geminicoccaceae bacterium]
MAAVGVACSLAVVPASASTVSETADLSDGGVTIQVDGDMLTVRIEEPTPLRAVLAMIGDATGAEVIVRRDPGSVGPVSIRRQSVAEVLRRLCGGNTFAIARTSVNDPGFDYDTMSAGRVKRIVVVGRDGPTLALRQRRVASAPASGDLAGESADELGSEAAASAEQHLLTLGDSRSPEAVTALGEALGSTDDPSLRRLAVSSLSRIGTPGALAVISQRGLVDSDASVRLTAAQALWQRQGSLAAPRLLSAAQVERDPNLRATLVRMASAARQKPVVDEPAPYD